MRRQVKTPNQHYLSGSFPKSGSRTTLALLLEQKHKIEIGERIKWLRDNSAETSRTIARYVDVSDEAVRNWIAGKGISWDSAEKVAELFHLDVGWVWRGEGEPPEGYPEPEEKETPDPFRDPYAEQLDRIERTVEEILRRLGGGESGDEGLPPEEPPPPPAPRPSAPDDGEPPSQEEAS